MSEIAKAAVIDAGVMGAGIAAQIANAGVPVVLLDIAAPDGDNRNAIAEGALAKLLTDDPAPFMDKANAELITAGNIEDHLDLLAPCDWIIEAVAEKPDIKRALYAKIETVRKPGSIVFSNTSTLALSVLTEAMAESLLGDFLIAHFFNPPRYMRLLELITGPGTRAEAVDAVHVFADTRLGKGVVMAKDRPGFIANRIGIFWLQCAVTEAMDCGLSVEEADAVLGRPLGIPKTGVFGLLDLVGLDLMPHILVGMADALPAGDAFHGISREPELIAGMIAKGYTGRKGKGGFYRLNTDGGKRVKKAIDLATGAYATAAKPRLDCLAAARKGGLRALVGHSDKAARFAWKVLSRTLSYAADQAAEIADDITAVDTAMRLGYNWSFGPFELIDKLGPAWLAEKLQEDGLAVPELLKAAGDGTFYRKDAGRLQFLGPEGEYHDAPRAEGVLLLSDVKLATKPLARNRSASLWDIGDGVVCLEFHSKMNSINPLTLAMIGKAVRMVGGGYKALVIYNEGTNFSVGANIGLLSIAAKWHAWFFIRWLLGRGQSTLKAMKYAPFPVVGAPAGMALGGGCEILLHCDAVQAHSETYAGLVETAVGIVPSWGGCKEMLLRWIADRHRAGGPMPPVIKVFETIGTATVSKSAAGAEDLLYLRPGDAITMNRDRLLADAKTKALELAGDYRPPAEPDIFLPGATAKAAMSMAVDILAKAGKATAHDRVVTKALAGVLSGGDTDITDSLGEDDLLALERGAFMDLTCHPDSLARVEQMLKTGKPLRN